MSLFCIVGFDVEFAQQKRSEHLEEHLQYLRKLKNEGKLLFAGPLQENSLTSGSMLIVNFDKKESAQMWFENDPYYLAGIFRELHIKEYIECIDQI